MWAKRADVCTVLVTTGGQLCAIGSTCCCYLVRTHLSHFLLASMPWQQQLLLMFSLQWQRSICGLSQSIGRFRDVRPQIRVPFACFFSSGQAPSDPGSRTMAKEGLKRHSERRLNKRLGVKQTPSMFVPGPSGLLRPMEGPEHSIMNR